MRAKAEIRCEGKTLSLRTTREPKKGKEERTRRLGAPCSILNPWGNQRRPWAPTLRKTQSLYFKRPEAMPSPPEYPIQSEWDALELAQLRFAKVLTASARFTTEACWRISFAAPRSCFPAHDGRARVAGSARMNPASFFAREGATILEKIPPP